MRKMFSAALVAAAATMSTGSAQAQTRPPAELPPAGFAGQQYVDSRGCVYVRAGHGGQTAWIARVDRARRPICGQTPSVTQMAAAQRELATPAAAPAPSRPAAAAPTGRVAATDYVPPPVTYGSPTPLRRAAPAPAPTAVVTTTAPPAAAPAPATPTAPVAAPQRLAANDGYLHGWERTIPPQYSHDFNRAGTPARQGRSTPTVGGHPPLLRREEGCPADAPIGRIYQLADGRNIMLCATSEHRLRNISTEQARARHAAAYPAAPARHPAATTRPGALRMVRGDQYAPASDLMTPPPGYKAAWQDDRLNPDRARGTAAGHAQMLATWTDTTPQTLRQPAAPTQRQRAVASSKSPPAPATTPVQTGTTARFVQVGSFAVPANASRAAARLQAMGLPVSIAHGKIKGKPVQVVRAGPFADPAATARALQAARAAGFTDAILRR